MQCFGCYIALLMDLADFHIIISCFFKFHFSYITALYFVKRIIIIIRIEILNIIVILPTAQVGKIDQHGFSIREQLDGIRIRIIRLNIHCL